MWLAAKGIAKAAWGFIRNIPWWLWLALGLLLAFWVATNQAHKNGVTEGKAAVQALWDAEKEKANRLGTQREKVTIKTEIRYVDRIKVIKEKGEVREKIVTKFVPRDSGFAGGGFRVYHDASVRDTVPDTSEIATAAPIPLTDVASTVNSNYALCHAAYARVAAWETWADEQCKLNKNGCPDGL